VPAIPPNAISILRSCLCRGTETESCLTPAQVEEAKKVHGPFVNPRTHKEIYPGLEPSSEPGWMAFKGPRAVSHRRRLFPVHNPQESRLGFPHLQCRPGRRSCRGPRRRGNVLRAVDPDLKKLVSHGGKPILYHGWSDNLIAPQNSVNYFNSVVSKLGGLEKTEESARLFMPRVWAIAAAARAHAPSTWSPSWSRGWSKARRRSAWLPLIRPAVRSIARVPGTLIPSAKH
jgi:hypothetical protein